jgi:hypothetical protein
MSLEEAIVKLTAAVEANTAALAGASKSTPSAGTSAKSTKPAGYTAQHTHEEMAAALGEVKEKFGAPAAKAIIKEVGGKDKMAEITDPKTIDATYDAAKAKLQEEEGM